MERSEQRKVVEALVLAAPEPITAARLAQIAPDCTPSLAKELVEELNQQYQEQGRSFEIWEVGGGYQLRTRAEFSGYLQQIQKHRPLRLSRAALETLSIVAYKQPVTRGEVEQVRGVDVGAVVRSLMERQLVRIVGQREVPGRPMLYGTTRRFLETFGLESLKGLPTLRELEEIARERGIENPDEVLGFDLSEVSAAAPLGEEGDSGSGRETPPHEAGEGELASEGCEEDTLSFEAEGFARGEDTQVTEAEGFARGEDTQDGEDRDFPRGEASYSAFGGEGEDAQSFERGEAAPEDGALLERE
jgi:segregation and condensation protein B